MPADPKAPAPRPDPPESDPVEAEDATAVTDDELLDDESMGEGLGPPPKEEKRSRLRWKKKEMPEGLWLKCESCGQMIYRKELEEKGLVCPACDFHFTLPGRDRIARVLDPGTWEERFAELTTLDRLEFKHQI